MTEPPDVLVLFLRRKEKHLFISEIQPEMNDKRLTEAEKQYDETVIELDPDNLDSTTIRYLELKELTRAELYRCIEQLLDELGELEFEIRRLYEDLN